MNTKNNFYLIIIASLFIGYTNKNNVISIKNIETTDIASYYLPNFNLLFTTYKVENSIITIVNLSNGKLVNRTIKIGGGSKNNISYKNLKY